jgi:hypothetical protein
MSQLEKATLQPISSDEAARPLGPPIPVQFNPSSLRLQIANQTEGGESRGRQVRQYTGSSSTTLSLELIFDTADEGAEDAPRSVREKTAAVEQFIYPQGEGDNKQAPPKLRFQWGDLILEGVVDSLTIDLDHFAPSGVPLRAKVGFSFKEQDRKYEFLQSGPGANRSAQAPLPGQAGSGSPGSTAQGGNRTALALGGESAAEFAARMGLDPAAWRGLSIGAGASLSLSAGLEVSFDASLRAAAGLGVQVGAGAGVGASLEASFGLAPSGGVSPTAGIAARAGTQQGFTLAAAGGLGAAVESVKIAQAEAAATAARQSFALAPVAAPPAPARPAMPQQVRTPLAQSGMPVPSVPSPAPPAPPPPAADPRAVSFGFGVPLRPTVGKAAERRASAVRGAGPLSESGVPVTLDPTVPGWVALAPRDPARKASQKAERRSEPPRPCGCRRPCAHPRSG